MLLLAGTGLLDLLARVVPREVVRGIQLGLGITLATLALKEYAGADGAAGYGLALAAAVLLLALRRQSRVPAPLVVIGLGACYALATRLSPGLVGQAMGVRLPTPRVPTADELAQGALLLALPQIPLSLGNSVIATSRATHDLFPHRPAPVRRIGFTYGLMNLVAPWFGGVPVCHGCGGLVGFAGFGARTGGAPVLYGAMYLVAGLLFAPGFTTVAKLFPLPVLGVVLLFEAVGLMMQAWDVAQDRGALWVTLMVAAAVAGLPNGYGVGLVLGTLLSWALRRGWVRLPPTVP
jgi:MFS superfamily sulfate permease-like transporter